MRKVMNFMLRVLGSLLAVLCAAAILHWYEADATLLERAGYY